MDKRNRYNPQPFKPLFPIETMKILVTNDDGIYADGIFFLKEALEKLGEVIVFAPDKERSAVGHALTMHVPLRVSEVFLRDGSRAYMTNGTPSDCVLLAMLMLGKPDLVASGINRGANLGDDITYSGTVSAAMEAAIHGVKAFSVSVAAFEDVLYSAGAHVASVIAEKIVENGLPEHTFLNVNVPNINSPKACVITKQGKRIYSDRLTERTDPRGERYFWISGEPSAHAEEGTDIDAVAKGCVSVTPLHLDMTNMDALEAISKWFL